MDITVEKVMDRQKIAGTIHQILDTGVALLLKEKLDSSDFHKIKLIRVISSPLNAAVGMIQQETGMIRAALVAERMKQLGYGNQGQEEIAA